MARSPRRKAGRKPRSRRKNRRDGRSRLRRLLRRSWPWLVGLPLVAGLAGFLWIDREVELRFRERTHSFPSRVYAAPFTLRAGGRLDPSRLERELQRLDYRLVEEEPVRPGQYRRRGNHWDLYLRETVTHRGPRPAYAVSVDAWWGRVRRIRDRRTSLLLDQVALEPQPLFAFYGSVHEERAWAGLEGMPDPLPAAVQVVEDRRFRSHHGIDPVGIGRALVVNLKAGGALQGGSTITQQLVKNLLGPGRRILSRKLVEAAGALTLELRHDKDEILQVYLNEVYLGQRGPVAISGVGQAAGFFFGRRVEELDLPRAALLAGLIRNPGRYNPWRHPGKARQRRDLVLRLMREQELIDETAYRAARAAGLGLRAEPPATSRLPWLEDLLGEEVKRIAPEALPSRAGFSIYTTFDPDVQRATREALAAGLQAVEERLGRGGPPLEGAAVVLRPDDGALLALVGGRDYGRSQFNRATDSHRPPGSTFKPFVFLAALERAASDPGFRFHAATILEDTPLELRSGGKPWRPANYDHTFRERVTARQALEESINVPTVRAALQVGLPAVVAAARRCGIRSELEPLPSLALGAEEVTPLELASAYAPFANGGWRVMPHALLGVGDRDDRPLADLTAPRVKVLTGDLAALMSDLLQGVMRRGTGQSARRLGFSGPAAGKTGTSDDHRDAWFVGYTPSLLALVWVGYDDNRPVGLPGASAALPIWVDSMKRLGADDGPTFDEPDGLERRFVDPATGGLATRRCRAAIQELFLPGTGPTEECPEHGRGDRRGFWRRLFGRGD